MSTGICLRVLTGHSAGVLSCAINESFIVSGSYDNTVKVWDRKSGLCLLTFQGHTEGVCGIELCGTRVISSSFDCTLRVWEISTGTLTAVLTGHSHYVYCSVSDGNIILSGCHDGTVNIWELVPSAPHIPGVQDTPMTGIIRKSFQCHKFAVRCLSYCRPYLVTGSLEESENVKLWNAQTGELVKCFSVGDSWTRSIDFSGLLIICAGDNHDISVMSRRNLGKKYVLKGHASIVSGVRLTDNRIVSCSFDKTIKVWNFGPCQTSLYG